MSDREFALGDRVTFTHTLDRRTQYRYREFYGRTVRDRWKVWTPQHAPHGRHGGVIVGRRTLANGVTVNEWEAGMIWQPESAERFRAYLVSWHIDKRPVWVLPEHLSRAQD